MKRYKVQVTEIRHYRMTYYVEAPNQDAAETAAKAGDTVEEIEGKCEGVAQRIVFGIEAEDEMDDGGARGGVGSMDP